MSDRLRAELALLLVTALWGVTFPLIRTATSVIDPHRFVALRFTLAALVFLPALGFPEVRRAFPRALFPGILAGTLAYGSYVTQTLGLVTVPANRAAFVTGTSVILVPLMAPAFRAGWPTRIDLGAALLATIGLVLMTAPDAAGFSRGDLLILGCAFAYAAYIHVLSIVLRLGHPPTAIALAQVVGIAACALLVLPFTRASRPTVWNADLVVALVVCALLATVLSFWLQSRFQGRTTPTRTALIFAMEPVFAALCAFVLLGETMGLRALAGAAVILAAVVSQGALAARATRTPPP